LRIRLAFLTASIVALPVFTALADDPQIVRGKYLVTIAGCNDCHTPGYFFGRPDMSRFLAGSGEGPADDDRRSADLDCRSGGRRTCQPARQRGRLRHRIDHQFAVQDIGAQSRRRNALVAADVLL